MNKKLIGICLSACAAAFVGVCVFNSLNALNKALEEKAQREAAEELHETAAKELHEAAAEAQQQAAAEAPSEA